MTVKRFALIGLVVLLISLLLGTAKAHAFYCGTRLISEGDSLGRVQALCGPPASVHHYVAYHSYGGFHRHQHKHRKHGAHYRYTYPVFVEEWRYNFGPGRFMQRVVFVDGTVARIRSEGYGY